MSEARDPADLVAELVRRADAAEARAEKAEQSERVAWEVARERDHTVSVMLEKLQDLAEQVVRLTT